MQKIFSIFVRAKASNEKAPFQRGWRLETLLWQGAACHQINACISFSWFSRRCERWVYSRRTQWAISYSTLRMKRTGRSDTPRLKLPLGSSTPEVHDNPSSNCQYIICGSEWTPDFIISLWKMWVKYVWAARNSQQLVYYRRHL